MKRILFTVLLSIIGFNFQCIEAQGGTLGRRPNVILIMADDLGYECLSSNGSTSYSTPNLDKLAETGARFTHCFVNPLCTPTRVALMTGRYNSRNYTVFGSLPQGEKTFGHMMQNAGYRTGVVGKWQLSHEIPIGQTPDQAGFDEYLMKIPDDSKGYADPVIFSKNLDPITIPRSYGPDIFYEFIDGFLERNQDRPFFLYYPMFLTHFDFQPTPDSPQWKDGDRHESHVRFFPDMVSYMDKNIGRIVKKLEELGLRKNTLIMFLGDNGTQGRIVSYMGDKEIRGGKSWLTDAGTHVPMVVNWPGKILPGQVRNDLVDPTDFFATIREATGVEAPEAAGDGELDGSSFLLPVTQQGGQSRDWIIIEYFENRKGFFNGQEGRYVRDRRWKLYEKGFSRHKVDKNGKKLALYKSGQLFDMVNDSEEKNPIDASKDNPETAKIRARFEKVLDESDRTHNSTGK